MNDKPREVQPTHYEQPEEGQIVTASTFQLQSAEIDQAIATAHRYPRDLDHFRKTVLRQVTLDADIAGKCIYALPRDGKTIEGPSIRFAEILYSSWKNCRVGSRIVDIGDEYVKVQGLFYDLEANVAITFELARRIVDKKGRRYSQDMIVTTANAAASIAIRNAVTRGIPQAFWSDAHDAARSVVAGDSKPLANRRADMLKAFAIFNVRPEQIFEFLGVKGIDDVTVEHLVTLAGMHTAMKDGDLSPEDAFKVERATSDRIEPQKSGQPSGFEQTDRKPSDEKPRTIIVEGSVKSDEDQLFRSAFEELQKCATVREVNALDARVSPAFDKTLDAWNAEVQKRHDAIIQQVKSARKA